MIEISYLSGNGWNNNIVKKFSYF